MTAPTTPADIESAATAWMAINLVTTVVLTATAYAAGRFDRRRERDQLKRELAHARQRLDTFATLLQPFAQAVREGSRDIRMAPEDMTAVALLVQHAGPDGEELVALDRQFHPKENR